AFVFRGRRHTVRALVDGAQALFRPAEVVDQPNMLPWSLIAFDRTTSPLRAGWTNAWGERVEFGPVVERALGLLEEASAPLQRAMREGREQISKAPVHSFTCAGTHMIYALLACTQTGHMDGSQTERLQQQVNLLVWRLRADLGLIDRFYKERASAPGVYWY